MLYVHFNSIVPFSYQQCLQTIVRTDSPNKSSSMNSNEILSVKNDSTPSPSAGKSKRAHYMSKLRGDRDSEYRRLERENNARAMRRKRREDPAYREHERRQNRVHMAELRRENAEYRQREHLKNRHRMASKRNLTSSESSTAHVSSAAENFNDSMIHSIYQTLENNLQAAHISFIPYQSSFDHQRQHSSNQKTEFDFLRQVDEFCRQQQQHEGTPSSAETSSSRTTLFSC